MSENNHTKRKIDPSDINLPPGYDIEVFATDLTTPINIIFNEDEMLIADSGVADGNGKVIRLTNNRKEIIADGFNPPLTGINIFGDDIYVSHRGKITIIKPDGNKVDIISGLPSWGDHHNNRVVFGPDKKMYFGQGTATNSGVVGIDNESWVKDYPYFHDYPGTPVNLVGKNFVTKNFLTQKQGDKAYTGAFLPFNVASRPFERVKGIIRASGSILRANPDGTNLELVAWGLRNPFRLRFDKRNRLFCADHGMDVRGSRPVANSPDEFHIIKPGLWYGWPDYSGGFPIIHPMFKPKDKPQPIFVLATHPMIPPKPFVNFTPHSATMGFDFNYNPKFGPLGDVYIAKFGSEAPRTTGGKLLPRVGHRVSMIDMSTGIVNTFAINKSGVPASETDGGGLERPIDVIFGPDGAMYVADFALESQDDHHNYLPNTGVIWRITRN